MRNTKLQTFLSATLCLGALSACGCVSETVTSGRPKIFDFSDAVGAANLWSVGFPHGVNLIVELEEGDLEKPDQQRLMKDLYRAQPFRSGNAEVWKIGEVHKLTYSNGRFETGKFSYTPRKRSRLFLFKKRTGNFKFRFHRQDIIVAARGTWQPALLYSTVELITQDSSPPPRQNTRARRSRPRRPVKRRQTVWLGQVLQIGTTTIRVDPRHGGLWTINDRNYRPNPDRPLTLEGVVRFAEK